MLHILNTRLKAYLSNQIAPEQAEFVKGRVMWEQIVILRQIIEKSRELNTLHFIGFVNFRKAFDAVTWECLWKVLLVMGVPQQFVFDLRSLYEDGTAAVRVDDVLSDAFKSESVVQKRSILSPLFFNTYFVYIMRIAVVEGWDKGVSAG
ncbi:uncharacterized protein LOC119629455 [Bombyx mori]|uniref:Reverse transcriptase domain-containing protein n=1 Tax=Bombyx mori TaxID=7091 RepID=A0A8R2M154_BOMMO|nr:uncharacterized protein LOC119629455 [Bombyx mori]